MENSLPENGLNLETFSFNEQTAAYYLGTTESV